MNLLISNLIKEGALKTKKIIGAFSRVDRKNFVLPECRNEAYIDHPLPIGFEQTISQPKTVAFMLELLQPQKGEKILDVGSGSGWTTALLADIVGVRGKVFGIEIIPELVSFGQKNLAKYGYSQAEILQAGKKLGFLREAPFDRILVSAEDKKIPEDLISQLKIGGTIVIPVGHTVYKIHKKSEKKLITQKFPGFLFVPLKRNT